MKTFFLALVFCISYVGAWAGLAGWEDVSQTIERDRVMSEAWHRINNEDAHLIYEVLESSAIDGWTAIKFCDETGEPGEVFSRKCTTYPTDYQKEHQ